MFNIQEKYECKQEFEENLLASMNSLYNLSYRMTNNRDDAYDLVQEASLRAYRFYGKYEKGTNFKAWLLTIARNIFINQHLSQFLERQIANGMLHFRKLQYTNSKYKQIPNTKLKIRNKKD